MGRKLTTIGKSTSERLLEYNKAQSPIVVRRKPSQSDGSEGDIVLSNEVEGIKMYAKINNRWHSFSSDEIKPVRKELFFIHGGWYGNDGGEDAYIPLRMTGSTTGSEEDYEKTITELNAHGYPVNKTMSFIPPFGGRVLTILM